MEALFWATLDRELPSTPDFPAFRGDFFIDGLEGGLMIWVVQTKNDLYGFAPLNLDFYTSHVKHLIRVGAEFNYCAGNQLLARGTVAKVA